MKKTLIFAAAALTVFAACSKEQDIVTPEVLPDGKVLATFVAEVEQTKATESLENNIIKFAWQASDVIAAVDKNASVINEFSCSNVSTGEFTGTHSGEFAYAIAPFAAAKSMVHISDQTGELVEYTITLPDTYTDYVPGTTNAIMVGTPNGNNKFLFRHVAAILKITVANVPVGTKSFWLKTNKKISGDYTFDSLTGVEIAETATTETEVALELKDAVTVPNQTLSFYVPVPTGSYTDFTVTLRDENLGELVHKGKSGLSMTLNRGDVYYTPTITLDAVDIPKGAEWAYTFEQKVFNENGTVTLSGTTDMDWTLAGDDDDKYWGYDATKGQQFGSGSKPYTSLSLSSSFGANYGISDVKINTSGASSIVGTVSVIVGNVAYKCENAESVDLTKDATDYTFSSPDGNNHSGDVVISYEQTSSKAIYLKSIVINPAAQLPQVATPTFSPAGGSYTETQNVTISCETADATIYYTLDGTDPSNQSTAYTSAIEISATTTVKAFAVKDGMADSEVAEAKYTISNTPAPTTGWIETALGDISSSDVFVIVGNNGDNYAMNHTTLNNSGAPTATAVSVTGSALSADPSDELKWNLSSDASGYMFYPDGVTDKWLNLIANNNGLRVSNTAANGKYWSLDAASGYLIGTDTADATRYIGIYNSTDWRSYTSINSNIASQTIKFYKYVSAPDNRDYAPISWSNSTGTATMSASGIVYDLPTFSNAESLAVTYASSSESVATISNGTVTAVGAGTTTISATYDGSGNATYKTTTVSYELTVADNRTACAAPSFSPAAGEVESGDEITITSATAGATIYYTTGKSDFSAGDWTEYTAPVAVTSACTIKAIAVKANYLNSEVASATYTIASSSSTIAQVLSEGAGTYTINNILVYAVLGNQAIVGDATGKMVLYKQGHGLEVGDNISIPAATVAAYNGILQIQDGTFNENSNGNAVDHGTATNLNDATVATSTLSTFLASGNHSAQFVTMNGTQSGRNINGTNASLYLSAANTTYDGQAVIVTGYIYFYNDAHSNYNFQLVSIEVDNTIPSISVAPASLSWAAAETDSKTLIVTLNGAAAADDYSYSVTSGNATDWNISDNGSGTLTLSPKAANTSTTAAKSLTLRISHADDSNIYQDVECSQAKAGNTTTTEEITSGTFTGDTNSLSFTTSSGITIAQLKNNGTNCNATYNTVSTLRVYRANQMQFTGKTFTKIEIYYTGSYSGASWSVVDGGGTVTIDTTNKKVVWTNTAGASKVTLQNSTSSGTNTQLRTTKFYFEY